MLVLYEELYGLFEEYAEEEMALRPSHPFLEDMDDLLGKR
jgi:hypothetical protein